MVVQVVHQRFFRDLVSVFVFYVFALQQLGLKPALKSECQFFISSTPSVDIFFAAVPISTI